MIHEENKKQQSEAQDFSLENFLGGEKKQPTETQQDDTRNGRKTCGTCYSQNR